MALDEWIEKLRESDKFILVEGKKDKAALEFLGCTNVITLKKPLYAVVEEIVGLTREIIILTDLDKEGKFLYARLNHDLQRHGVKVDRFFRQFLFRNSKLRQIEGLPRYMNNHRIPKPLYII